MIDTDKYEGHNMHPALLDVGNDYNNWDALQDMGFNDEARQLMADAPILLEEVKRLREENNCYLDFILWLGIEHKGKELAWEYGDEKIAEML